RQRRRRRRNGARRAPPGSSCRRRRGLPDQREDRPAAEPLRQRRLSPGVRRRGPPLLLGRLVRPRIFLRRPRARTRRHRNRAVDRDRVTSGRTFRLRRADARAARDRPDPRLQAGPRVRGPLPPVHREGAPADVRAPEGLPPREGARGLAARRASGLLRADRVRLVLRVLRQGRRLAYRAAPFRLAAAAERPAILPKTAPAISPAPPG